MKIISLIGAIVLLFSSDNPNLDQDIIYPKASEVNIGNGEICEVINEKEMEKAKGILQKYWDINLSDTTWAKYNRQYMVYNSSKMGRVVYINGVCLAKPAEFFQKTWCVGMAAANCYYTTFVDLKKKRVVSFEFNTYKK